VEFRKGLGDGERVAAIMARTVGGQGKSRIAVCQGPGTGKNEVSEV
jgi:hypothetical protein